MAARTRPKWTGLPTVHAGPAQPEHQQHSNHSSHAPMREHSDGPITLHSTAEAAIKPTDFRMDIAQGLAAQNGQSATIQQKMPCVSPAALADSSPVGTSERKAPINPASSSELQQAHSKANRRNHQCTSSSSDTDSETESKTSEEDIVRDLHDHSTVTFHPEKPEAIPCPWVMPWDASRGNLRHGGPPISTDKLALGVAQDTRRAIIRGQRPGWDVGDRPIHQMAHFEYPGRPAAPLVAERGELSFSTQHRERGEQRAYERQRRLRAVEAKGFNSVPPAAYAPLGDLEGRVEPVHFLNDRSGGLVLVEPDIERRATLEAAQRPTVLQPDQKVTSVVRKHRYVYFCVDKPPGKMLRIKAHTIRGDPDLYVCNMQKAPTHEKHTWRATSIGDDAVDIPPNDQEQRPRRYYIGVFGIQDTSFDLTVQFLRKQNRKAHFVFMGMPFVKRVTLPKKPEPFLSKSSALIQKEIAESAKRTKLVASGGSLLAEVRSDMRSRGFEAETVQAAASPILDKIERQAQIQKHAPRATVDLGASLGWRPASAADTTRADMSCTESFAKAESRSPGKSLDRDGSSVLASAADDDGEHGLGRSESRLVETVAPTPLPPKPQMAVIDHDGPLQVSWQPPVGVEWSDLPSGARLEQASKECIQSMRDSEARLREQLAALSTRRPLQYQWRLQTLSAMDPTSNLCQPKTMRQGVAAIDARYRRAFTPPPSKTQVTGSRRLNGSASAGMLSLPGAGWRALREHDVHHHRRSSRTGSMSAAAFLQRELQPSGFE